MTDTEWILELIGKPWVSGARGPAAFDCWGLLVYVYQTQFGIEIDPTGIPDAKDVTAAVRFADCTALSGPWAKVTEPRHGDAVGMSSNRRIHHVGVYLEIDGGMILHARDKANVVIQDRFRIQAAGIRTLIYYRHEAMLCKDR